MQTRYRGKAAQKVAGERRDLLERLAQIRTNLAVISQKYAWKALVARRRAEALFQAQDEAALLMQSRYRGRVNQSLGRRKVVGMKSKGASSLSKMRKPKAPTRLGPFAMKPMEDAALWIQTRYRGIVVQRSMRALLARMRMMKEVTQEQDPEWVPDLKPGEVVSALIAPSLKHRGLDGYGPHDQLQAPLLESSLLKKGNVEAIMANKRSSQVPANASGPASGQGHELQQPPPLAQTAEDTAPLQTSGKSLQPPTGAATSKRASGLSSKGVAKPSAEAGGKNLQVPTEAAAPKRPLSSKPFTGVAKPSAEADASKRASGLSSKPFTGSAKPSAADVKVVGEARSASKTKMQKKKRSSKDRPDRPWNLLLCGPPAADRNEPQ
jgi:hypothetical protein